MSKPKFIQFDMIDKKFRVGTGALPVVLIILAILSLAGGLLGLMDFSSGVVSCALLLAVSAIVRSIRNIEAYTIYIAQMKEHEMGASTSASAPAEKKYID